MNAPEWTSRDMLRLRHVYGTIPASDLAAHFPGRTEKAIREKARRIGLRSSLHREQRGQRLSQAFYEEILAEFAADKIVTIAARRGVPEGTVSSWVSRAKWRRDAQAKKSPGSMAQPGE